MRARHHNSTAIFGLNVITGVASVACAIAIFFARSDSVFLFLYGIPLLGWAGAFIWALTESRIESLKGIERAHFIAGKVRLSYVAFGMNAVIVGFFMTYRAVAVYGNQWGYCFLLVVAGGLMVLWRSRPQSFSKDAYHACNEVERLVFLVSSLPVDSREQHRQELVKACDKIESLMFDCAWRDMSDWQELSLKVRELYSKVNKLCSEMNKSLSY